MIASGIATWATSAEPGTRLTTFIDDTDVAPGGTPVFVTNYTETLVDLRIQPVVAVVLAAAIGAVMVWLARVALDVPKRRPD